MWDIATVRLRPIFVAGYIADPSLSVLNIPIDSHERQQPYRVSTLRQHTRDASTHLLSYLSRLFLDHLASI